VTTNHKSALVTGGGTGIGKAVAARLVSGGYDVTIVGRREDILRRTATELAEHGPGTVRIDVADMAASDAPEAVIASHVDAFGGINALVTAAAFYEPIPFLDTTAETWDATLHVALRGTVLAAAAAARHMVGAGGGRIVLFSSINGFHSEPDSADYSAAKFPNYDFSSTLAGAGGGNDGRAADCAAVALPANDAGDFQRAQHDDVPAHSDGSLRAVHEEGG